MNVNAIKKLKSKLAAGEPVYGMWITLEAPAVSMIGAAMGLDWLVIEGEHGHLDMKELSEHVRSAVRSNTVVLTRISELNRGLIKKVLDIGVDIFFFGPNDYSASAGYAGQWEGPGAAAQILKIKDTIIEHGKHCGLLATSEEALLKRRQR